MACYLEAKGPGFRRKGGVGGAVEHGKFLGVGGGLNEPPRPPTRTPLDRTTDMAPDIAAPYLISLTGPLPRHLIRFVVAQGDTDESPLVPPAPHNSLAVAGFAMEDLDSFPTVASEGAGTTVPAADALASHAPCLRLPPQNKPVHSTMSAPVIGSSGPDDDDEPEGGGLSMDRGVGSTTAELLSRLRSLKAATAAPDAGPPPGRVGLPEEDSAEATRLRVEAAGAATDLRPRGDSGTDSGSASPDTGLRAGLPGSAAELLRKLRSVRSGLESLNEGPRANDGGSAGASFSADGGQTKGSKGTLSAVVQAPRTTKALVRGAGGVKWPPGPPLQTSTLRP